MSRGLLPIAVWTTLAVPLGASAQTPDRLQHHLQLTLDSLASVPGIPGMTLGVALPDGTAFGLAAGFADTVTGERMPANGRMLQGSIGKTYFGAVALQLVREGRLDLDTPIAGYFGQNPWLDRVPNGRSVTLRQVMNHTSGIVRYEFNPAFLEDFRADPMRSYSPEERLSYLYDADAPFAPGEGWEYSDTNYILVAMLIEQVTGETAYDEIRRRLLHPLDLMETVPSDRPIVEGLVQGYAGANNPFGTFDATKSGGGLAFNPQFEWGGGGFASSARDLARWIKYVQEGRAFASDLLEEYRTGVPAPLGPNARYGLGVIMMRLPAGPAWGHSGFMPGYRSEAYYFPEHDFGIALQVNTSHGEAYRVSPLRMLSQIAQIVKTELDTAR